MAALRSAEQETCTPDWCRQSRRTSSQRTAGYRCTCPSLLVIPPIFVLLTLEYAFASITFHCQRVEMFKPPWDLCSKNWICWFSGCKLGTIIYLFLVQRICPPAPLKLHQGAVVGVIFRNTKWLSRPAKSAVISTRHSQNIFNPRKTFSVKCQNEKKQQKPEWNKDRKDFQTDQISLHYSSVLMISDVNMEMQEKIISPGRCCWSTFQFLITQNFNRFSFKMPLEYYMTTKSCPGN